MAKQEVLGLAVYPRPLPRILCTKLGKGTLFMKRLSVSSGKLNELGNCRQIFWLTAEEVHSVVPGQMFVFLLGMVMKRSGTLQPEGKLDMQAIMEAIHSSTTSENFCTRFGGRLWHQKSS
jgi:hypothetical protein